MNTKLVGKFQTRDETDCELIWLANIGINLQVFSPTQLEML